MPPLEVRMSISTEFQISFLSCVLGLSMGFGYVLEHGFADTWLAWEERQWQVAGAFIFTSAGLFCLAVIFARDYLTARRRYRARKAYGERYR